MEVVKMVIVNPLEMLLMSEEARKYLFGQKKERKELSQYKVDYYSSSGAFPTGNCAL